MKLEIFDMDQEYHEDFESFCSQNCIKHVLNYYGVERMFMYLDTSLNLKLIESVESKLGYSAKFKNNLVVPDYKNKIKLYTPEDKSAREIWENNKRKLNEGIPVIVGVDIFHLDYSMYHNVFHSDHRVILCGYSDDEKYAKIVDWYEWVYKGNVELEQFLNARSSLCPPDDSPYSGSPIMNVWMEVEPSNWFGNIEELLKITVDTTIKDYYETSSNLNDTEYYGIEALRKIFAHMVEYKEMDKDSKLETVNNVLIVIMFLYKRLRMFRYYIMESSNYVNIDLILKLLQMLNEDIEIWIKVIHTIVKSSFDLSGISYNKILNHINRLISIEDKRYKSLIQLNKVL